MCVCVCVCVYTCVSSQARNIRNKPVVNQDPQSTIVAAMEREIHSLRAELQRAQQPTSSSATTITTTVDSSVMVEVSGQTDRQTGDSKAAGLSTASRHGPLSSESEGGA